jgi:antitoxin HigA-1
MVMQTKLRSRTTTKPAKINRTVTRRLPAKRPPTHPGEMLLEEFLRPLGISQSAFAARLGISPTSLNEIIRRKRSVTPDTALRLARVVGLSADFWLGLQQDWDLWHAARSKRAARIARLEPIFIARAGLDQVPTMNDSIDRFVREAISRNASIIVANHPQGVHGFDNQTDDERSREIIRSAIDFMKIHLGVMRPPDSPG